MLELYYFPDATCGIKARLTLFEKGVDFERRVLDRFGLTSPEYLAINPKGVVPTLVHDGTLLYESSVICLYVDHAFDGSPLLPDAALDRAHMYTWLKRIDEEFFKGIGSTTFGLALRKTILERHPDSASLEAYFENIKVDEYRTRRRSIIANGIDAPEVHSGLRVLFTMVKDLNQALKYSSYAAGPRYSLADACLTPFVLRLDIFGLRRMWDDFPRVADWWSRIQSRDSYKALIEESFPGEYVTEMRERVGDVWPQVAKILEDS